MRVLLVARDVGPSKAFTCLANALQLRGAKLEAALGFGENLAEAGTVDDDNIARKVKASDIVLIGLSSTLGSAYHEMLAARTAKSHNIPFGFFSDTFGVFNRPWLGELRNEAAFVCVASVDEKGAAQKLFPNSEIVASGNPLWENFFVPIDLKKAQDKVRYHLGIEESSRVILCAGGTTTACNLLLLGAVIEAVPLLGSDLKNWRIVYAIHPGDSTPASVALLCSMVNYVPGRVSPLSPDELPMAELIAAADVVVESFSTVGIEAICRRKPVINYFTEVSLGRLEELSGSRVWPPCQGGAAMAVYGNPAELADKILNLLLFGGYDKMRIAQEQSFPRFLFEKKSVAVLADTLQKFAKRR